jgi:carbonic anhydrase/acetyltransferase-like protein (isoleucine patch superfamily)
VRPPLILPYDGILPTIAEGAWIAAGCVIAGDVVLSDRVSIWFGTVIRGDVNRIRIGARTNVQDGCILHVSGDAPMEIGPEVTIGHGAILHGCSVGAGALIGIGARLLDHVEIGEEALVGAGSLVVPGTKIPPGVLALGSPARVTRSLSAEERARNREAAVHYVEYARAYRSR